jgi:hypothetical protein
MALLEGKPAETIAKEIIEKAVKNVQIELSAQTFAELVKLTRYSNRVTIFNRGEKSYEQNKENWIRETTEKLITSRYDQLEKQMNKAAQDSANEYFQLLVSRGMDKAKAYDEAFGVAPKPDPTPIPIASTAR